MTSTPSSSHRNFFVRCWTGRAPLWQAFWLCGIAGAVVVLTVVPAIISANSLAPVPARLLFGAVGLAYASFASVSIWRCAGTEDVSPLGALAKVYAVVSFPLWAMLMFFALTFQE